MSVRQATPGELIIDQFAIWDYDGYTKVSGQASFYKRLWFNGAASSVPVTIAEIGSTGEYKVEFTPDEAGFWLLEVEVVYNHEVWESNVEVREPNVDIQASMADDNTDATFAVWVELDGERLTDIDSIAAKVKDSNDVEVHDFGTNGTPTSDGVFKFTVSSSALTAHVPYLVAATATRGAKQWNANLGFAKA